VPDEPYPPARQRAGGTTTGATRAAARALAVWLALACAGASAAPEEIQVYIDDLTRPGRFGLDVHNNYVFSGSGTPAYAGAQPPVHVYRLTPEFYYGLNDSIELGLYLLGARRAGGDADFDGAKLRFKYVAPHDAAEGAFWGTNVELGDTAHRVSENPYNLELKGIYGYRSERWLLAVNGNFDRSVAAPAPWTFELDSKAALRLSERYQIGLESYNELGLLHDLGHLGRLSQTLYGVLDADLGFTDLNAGLGRGLTGASDRWTLKFILGFHF